MEKTKKELSENTKIKLKKILFKSLEILFCYILPILCIGLKYDLFTKANAHYKLTGIGLIIAIVVFVAFWKNIKQAIADIKNPIWRKIFSVIKNFAICVFLCYLLGQLKRGIDNLESAKKSIDSLMTVIILCGLSLSIGNIFKEDYIEMKKATDKLERQDEMVEAILKAKDM